METNLAGTVSVWRNWNTLKKSEMNLTTIKYKTDAASVNHIYSHLSECSESFEPPLEQKVNISEYAKKIAERSTTFEAWFEDKLVGLVAAYFNDKQKGKGYITNVSTAREYLGNRIASSLVKNCIEYAAENDFSEIGLEVNANNQKAIKLYEKFGFMPVDSNFENIIMRCSLK